MILIVDRSGDQLFIRISFAKNSRETLLVRGHEMRIKNNFQKLVCRILDFFPQLSKIPQLSEIYRIPDSFFLSTEKKNVDHHRW
jgi:hypothetical protein